MSGDMLCDPSFKLNGTAYCALTIACPTHAVFLGQLCIGIRVCFVLEQYAICRLMKGYASVPIWTYISGCKN